MAENFEHGEAGGSPFGAVDPKLTIYALANGMDLIKGEGSRRLEWYRDGRDRGILVSAEAGSVSVHAMAWHGDPDAAQKQSTGDPMAPGDFVAELSIVLAGATEVANAL